MVLSRFRPCRSGEPARCISELLHRVGTVGCIVPGGFESYVRVLPPFEGPDDAVLSWEAVANRVGRSLEPLTDSEELEELLEQGLSEEERAHLGISPPFSGHVPMDMATVLVGILRRHTDTPQECYFAVWDGYGGLQPRQGWGAKFRTPGRDRLLYTASLEAATDGFSDFSGLFPYSADLWWPADHRWFVATDVDIQCTYIGCDASAAHELQLSQIETIEVNWTDKLAA